MSSTENIRLRRSHQSRVSFGSILNDKCISDTSDTSLAEAESFGELHMDLQDRSDFEVTGAGGDTTTEETSDGWSPQTIRQQCMRKLRSYAHSDDNTLLKRFLKIPHAKVHHILNQIQMVVLIAVAVCAAIIPETRRLFLSQMWRDNFVIMTMELGVWFSLSLILGRLKKLPVNYIPLVVSRSFVNLGWLYYARELTAIAASEEARRQQLLQNEVGSYTLWLINPKWWFNVLFSWMWTPNVSAGLNVSSTLIAKSPRHTNLVGLEPYVCTAFLVLLPIVITKATKIRIDKGYNAMLTLTFFSSTLGTIALLTSLIPNRIGTHVQMQFCQFWGLFTVLLIVILPFYIFQRLLLQKEDYWLKRKWAEVNLMWMGMETMLWIMNAFLISRHLYVVHSGFLPVGHNPYLTSRPPTYSLINTLTPGVGVNQSALESIPTVMFFFRTILAQMYGAWPKTMGQRPPIVVKEK